jgi:hypothetical protein
MVKEIDDRGRKYRTTPGKDRGRGYSQRAPISPLLANLYTRRFILGWTRLGYERRLCATVATMPMTLCQAWGLLPASALFDRIDTYRT